LIGLFQPMPLRRLGVFVATCAHVGYAPVAPGTFGSLLALVLYYVIRRQQSTAIELGARLLQAADDLTAAEGHQVYADPAGHPFCLGWGHPDDETIRRFLGQT